MICFRLCSGLHPLTNSCGSNCIPDYHVRHIQRYKKIQVFPFLFPSFFLPYALGTTSLSNLCSVNLPHNHTIHLPPPNQTKPNQNEARRFLPLHLQRPTPRWVLTLHLLRPKTRRFQPVHLLRTAEIVLLTTTTPLREARKQAEKTNKR